MDRLFSLFKQIETEKSPSEPVSHIIVGLGNPGDKYKYTRHNAGFLALSYVQQKLNVAITKSKFKALYTECTIGGKRALLMLPQTYMNNSGEAVRAAMDFYKIPIENVLVIYDDISLDCGKLRIRKNGSAGGHDGIKSIIEHNKIKSQNNENLLKQDYNQRGDVGISHATKPSAFNNARLESISSQKEAVGIKPTTQLSGTNVRPEFDLSQKEVLQKALDFVKDKKKNFETFCLKYKIDYKNNYNYAVLRYYQAYIRSTMKK